MCDWYEKGRGKGKARQYCGSVGVRGRVMHRKCTCLSDGRGMTTRCRGGGCMIEVKIAGSGSIYKARHVTVV